MACYTILDGSNEQKLRDNAQGDEQALCNDPRYSSKVGKSTFNMAAEDVSMKRKILSKSFIIIEVILLKWKR